MRDQHGNGDGAGSPARPAGAGQSDPVFPAIAHARARRGDLRWRLLAKTKGSPTPSPGRPGRRIRSATTGRCSPAGAGPVRTTCPLLRQPVLLVAGDDDPIIPLVNAKMMARLLRKPTVHIVHGGGHLALLTHADELVPAIHTFLS
ncbi:alpha/beta fold hydrolase [Fodinicola feengrottensis]|uniref:alpha/beta fold hydrolase n=1 Tax=Fodinicola feengrottensis TaxID=435914 RepID=UPI0036F3E059